MRKRKSLVILTGLTALFLASGPSNASPLTPTLSGMVRTDLLIPGTTYMNTGNSQIDHGALTSDGGAVVCGFIYGKRTFGKTTIASHKVTNPDPNSPWQEVDPFIAKASADGKWLWAVTVPSTLGGSCRTVSVLPNGSIRARINFQGSAKFAGKTLNGPGNADVLVTYSGQPTDLSSAPAEPESTIAGTNLYTYTDLEESPAYVGGRSFGETTYWNVKGSTLALDRLTDAGGVVAKMHGNGWDWVTRTPGNSEVGDVAIAVTKDGGAVTSLRNWGTDPVTYAGFTSTTGQDSLIKFDSTGLIVWGFEVPDRKITAFADLSSDNFIITQGVESAFEVTNFKLQIYSMSGQLQQSLALPNVGFPPREIYVVSKNKVWLRTSNSLILLGPKAPVSLNCKFLNAKYPGGIAYSAKAKNKGTALRYKPTVSASIYNTYKALDTDKDLLVCER